MISDEEKQDRRPLVIALALLGAVVLVVLLGRARERLAPQPRAAHLAIEVGGSGVAATGRVEIESGTPFTLHAVLEAEDLRGRRVYYTEASRLRIAGEEIDPELLRPWDGALEARVLWFVVEGETPYVEASDAAELADFGFREVLRPDWPHTWSVPGMLDPSWLTQDQKRRRRGGSEFGSQSFHVRIELFGRESGIRPRARFGSPGAASLPDGAADVATVVARLPGALAAASAPFGLTQIEVGPDPEPALKAAWRRWIDADLAFSRGLAIRRHLESLGLAWDRLSWQDVDLSGGTPWGGPGDVIRAGARVVVAYRDLGVPGQLDYEDEVLDFDHGAAILELREVFTGEGLVERAEVPRQAP